MKTPAQKIISALFDADDIINVRVIADGGGKASNSLTKADGLELTLFAEQYLDAFPCVAINPRKNLRTLATIKNLAIDIDGAPLPAWAKERADIICTRDPLHHHLYFCFAEGVTREEYKATAARLIAATPGADKAVSDPERVLRLPGFAYNKKGVSGEGYKIAFMRKKIDRLPIAEKFAWLKPAEVTAPTQQVNDVQPNPTPAPVAAPNAVAYLKNLYAKKEKLTSGEGRSRRLWFVGIDCHAWGIKLDDALTLAAEINQSFAPPETAQVVSHQIKSAYKYAKGEFGALANRAADATEAKRRAEFRAFEHAQKVRDLFANWVYVHAAARFCNSENGYALASKEQIEDYITAAVGETVSLRNLLARDALTRCDRMEFDPTRAEQIFERDGLQYYNAYAAPRDPAPRDPKHKKTAVAAFKEHVGYLTTSEDEEKHLLDYFAYCVQNKGKKVDWTPLLISKEGVGKSAFYSLFSKIFGEHNCATVDAENLLEGWTDFIAEKLFVVSHEVEMTEKQGLKKLKTLITERRVRINAKYERKYETTNCANFLLLSNEANALRLSAESRRFFVIFSRAEPRPKKYYSDLFAAIENGAGWIEDYLLARDLKDFSPHGPAPKTEGLKILALASRGDGAAWLDERAASGDVDAFGRLTTAAAIQQDATQYAPQSVMKYVTQRAAAAWLANNGYRPVVYRDGVMTRRGWFKGSEAEFQAELKKMKEKVEEKTGAQNDKRFDN
jgi:hypothetical protein